MKSKEYLIWGKAPNSTGEELLVSEKAGIDNQAWADRVLASLESKHGCSGCRIQVIDFSVPLAWDARSMVNV